MTDRATTEAGTTRRRQRRPAVIPPTKLAYSIVEFAAALGISRPTVYSMIHEGQIRTVLIGRRRLIPASEIERVLSGER